jgi:hypothetical protein
MNTKLNFNSSDLYSPVWFGSESREKRFPFVLRTQELGIPGQPLMLLINNVSETYGRSS